MMGLALDEKQNANLDCMTCDRGLQKLRNCGGSYSEKSRSPIQSNGEIYWVCPRSLTFNRKAESQIFNMYLICKDNKTFPYGSSPLAETSYCLEVFKFLDGVLSDYHARKDKEQQSKVKK